MKIRTISLSDFFRISPTHQERETLPLSIKGRKIYVSPNRQGFVFLTLLITLLFGSVNHNNNLGFLVTFLLGGIAIVSIFHTYRNISGIQIISAKAEPVFAEHPAQFKIIIDIQKMKRPAVSFSFYKEKEVTINITASPKQVVNISHPSHKRGKLKPQVLQVSTTYPLGLFKCWTNILLDTYCLVYPKPLAGPIIGRNETGNSDYEGETGGTGADDFTGLDRYKPGDLMQRISWKTYSRGQGLHTKKFEGQQGEKIYFDPDILPGNDLEQKLSRICFMVINAEAVRRPYGLKIGNSIITPDLGGTHKKRCLHALALTGSNE